MTTIQTPSYRLETDSLGSLEIPVDVLHGIHTVRALANFPISGVRVHPALVRAYGQVKLACFNTNLALGYFKEPDKAGAIARACSEMAGGLLLDHIVVDAMQGGAGTSTNMNVNEVIANRALCILGLPPGDYTRISPLDDINLHQSTNDTYPTALRVAAITQIKRLEQSVVALQEAFQSKEKEFARVVKVGRTQLQDAVLVTLGREMGAYAEALTRDRWRIYKCEERLRTVNLGGTAVGTGLGAPRQYIFRVVDELRNITGLGLARAENLVEATQNADAFVEVSGILKALAVSLFKISADLRILSSGPEAGLGEIRLPARQAGSSIMPGKVNPVVPEAAQQAAMMVMGYDQAITMACASGCLELNPFLPLVARCLLDSITLLTGACDTSRMWCVEGIAACDERCAAHVAGSTASATALLQVASYGKAAEIALAAVHDGRTVKDVAVESGVVTGEAFDALVGAEAVCKLGN
ncbi:MAG: aspartate ammonia-lyase [Myxococcota bacterium]|jgi:aspartate ammonia-lyase